MEMWARWAHKALWHDFAPGWALHESHHRLRVGPFEANDVFAIVNAVPAIALLAYGFFTPTISGGIAFGGGKDQLIMPLYSYRASCRIEVVIDMRQEAFLVEMKLANLSQRIDHGPLGKSLLSQPL